MPFAINGCNHLNLPQQIEVTNSSLNEINYLYAADGTKLKKQTKTDHAVGTTMDYVGNVVYEDGQISYILTSEGRLLPDSDSTFGYQYFLKDHLGNNRVLFDQSGTVLQENAFYPFGMEMEGLAYSSGTTLGNKYLYNGKELQSDFGLGWYDFHARFYDPAIVRTPTQDPHAENYYSWSPYSMFGNNPMVNIDPTGMDWYDVNGNITWHDQEGELKIDDNTYQSLGKNVIVATHNRDEDGKEEINTASFSVYLESNTEGASATIEGNTVPADVEGKDFSTLAEGVYGADFAARSSKPGESAVFISALGETDPEKKRTLPNTKGGTMEGIFIHSGNPDKATLISRDGVGSQYSEGCMTTVSGPGSKAKHENFMKVVGKKFSGTFYLRGKK
jgi:RHS repeat-associated protein